MHCYLHVISILILSFSSEIAEAGTYPSPTSDAPRLSESLPQITQAPAPFLHRDAIQGRQATSWNTCTGFSVEGLPDISAGVSCVAPYTCLVGVHSVSPYWGCLLPTTSADWYTRCIPYAATQSIYYSHTRYCASTAPYCITQTLIDQYISDYTYWNYACGTMAFADTIILTAPSTPTTPASIPSPSASTPTLPESPSTTTSPSPTSTPTSQSPPSTTTSQSTPAATSTGSSGGLSTSDRIALGCGIGIGVPSAIAAILTLWVQCVKG